MRKAWRNIDLREIFGAQFDRKVPAECGGSPAQINADIKGGAVHDTHKLSLRKWRALEMQAAHSSRSR